jgi:hypothetical protein
MDFKGGAVFFPEGRNVWLLNVVYNASSEGLLAYGCCIYKLLVLLFIWFSGQ